MSMEPERPISAATHDDRESAPDDDIAVPAPRLSRWPIRIVALASTALLYVTADSSTASPYMLLLLALLATAGGVAVGVMAYRLGTRNPRATDALYMAGSIVLTVVGGFLTVLMYAVRDGVHFGRPLRIAGRTIVAGSADEDGWAVGPAPECSDLSPDTRAALAALWRRDALAEHASVPAFSRIAWLLAGLGAPAQLLAGAQRAASQEVEHACGCFALAAGYAGAPVGPTAMPELLRSGPEPGGDPLTEMARESLRDGCLYEGFYADLAAVARTQATDPAVSQVLARIADDEQDHADLAWRILEWCLARGGAPVRAAMLAASRALPDDSPLPFGIAEAALVARADLQALRAHGRVPVELWPSIYATRLASTRDRVARLLEERRAA